MPIRPSLALALMLACAGCHAGAGEAGEDETVPTAVPTPRFTDPENLSKVVRADRDEPIELGIADAREDLWIEIDGRRFDASPGGVVERLGEDRLQLRVEGSMLALLHDVVLAQRDGAEILRSESLTLGVVHSEIESISASADASVGLGEHVGARGVGEQALLGRLSGETLTLHRSEASGEAWAWSEPIADVELPGILGDVHSWTAILEAGEPWIAWRVAMPTGDTAIHVRVGEAGEVQTVWASDQPETLTLLGSHEYASLDAVAWIGRSVLIPGRGIRDVERATPGDRVVLMRRIDPSGGLSNPMQVVRGPGQRDLDSMVPRIDLGTDELAVLIRLGRALPQRMGVSASGLPELTVEPATIELAEDLRWFGGIDAAFGSRQLFWIANDGLRLGCVGIDRLLDRTQASEVALSEPPSGPLVFAVLGGVPTIVIPRGPDQPMQVVRSTGAELELAELPGPHCHEVALLISLAGSRAGSLPFACLSAGQLRLGSLTSP